MADSITLNLYQVIRGEYINSFRKYSKLDSAYMTCMHDRLLLFFHILHHMHSNLFPRSRDTHTHTYAAFFHPLIPNCLRKWRVEIPLQSLGSALFGKRPLSHIVFCREDRRTFFPSVDAQNLLCVSPSPIYCDTWYTRWHVSKCQKAAMLGKHPENFKGGSGVCSWWY